MALPALLKDTKYPHMWRIKYEDGEISDMYNKAWAKEHLRRYLETKARRERGHDLHPASRLPDQEKEEQGAVSGTTSRPNRHI